MSTLELERRIRDYYLASICNYVQLRGEPNRLYRFKSERLLDKDKNVGETHVLVKDPFGFQRTLLVPVASIIWDSTTIRSGFEADLRINPEGKRPASFPWEYQKFDTHFSDGTPPPSEPASTHFMEPGEEAKS